jgi:hypothetical protein
MRTDELMQGDIVRYEGDPVYVMAILNFDEIQVSVDLDADKWATVNADDCMPMELTGELLQKNGLVQQGNRYLFPSEPWIGCIKDMPGLWYTVDGAQVSLLAYVHQFQHLLKDVKSESIKEVVW